MSYFAELYKDIKYLIESGEARGLRVAQLGAIHSLGSYFTLKKDPAIIVMPTGTGKTAVLEMTPYITGAKRVLIVAPSRVIRNQLRDNFASLKTLKAIGVLDKDKTCPRVYESRHL
jgi:superfamily II DNA or RNA helicase